MGREKEHGHCWGLVLLLLSQPGKAGVPAQPRPPPAGQAHPWSERSSSVPGVSAQPAGQAPFSA